MGQVIIVKHKALLPRPTFGDTSTTMSACFFYLFFNLLFSLLYAVVQHTPVLSFTPHKEPERKLVLSVFPKDITKKCPVRASNPQPYDHLLGVLTNCMLYKIKLSTLAKKNTVVMIWLWCSFIAREINFYLKKKKLKFCVLFGLIKDIKTKCTRIPKIVRLVNY